MSTSDASKHFVSIRSAHSVTDTVEKLERLVKEHGLTVFARIDFSADAERAGLALRPERLLIFGNPKGGTALLQASPTVGLDLPLKALVWEEADGTTWLAYNTTDYILDRHAVPGALAPNIEGAIALIRQAAQ